MLLGIPAAIKQIVESPPEAVSQMIADFKHRYGPLIEGNPEAFRRIALEQGATPYVLDALVGATPGSQIVGRAAKAGTLGARAERFANRARPARQMTPTETLEARSSSGIVGAVAQRAADSQALRRTERRAKAGDPLALDALGRGNVVALRAGRGLRKGVAREKAVSRQLMLSEQGRGLAQVSGLLKEMSKIQRAAVKDALDLGIRSPDKARDVLTARVAAIHRNRDGEDFGKLDNVPELMQVIERADEIFTPEFGELVDKLRRTEKRAVGKASPSGRRTRKSDPGLAPEQAAVRRYLPAAEHFGIKRAEGESAKDFIGRVSERMKQEGLAVPGYFPSELSRKRRFSERAVGGTRASHRTKPYSGELFRKGIENRDLSALERGLARNVKRRYNWNLVSEIIERNSFEWGQGKSLSEQLKEMGRRGVSEESVAFMNPGMLRAAAEGELEGPARAARGSDDRLADPALVHGLRQSIIPADAAIAVAPEFAATRGWYAVPRNIADELEAGFSARAGGRLADLAQEKSQRWMLAWNFGWIQFQAVSNVAQAALAGATPFDMARGWWVSRKLDADSKRPLDREARDQLAARIGLSQSAEMRQTTRLGGTSTHSAVEAYRLMKESKFGTLMAKANPIELFFKAAHGTDNLPRMGVAYKLARKEAFRNLEGGAGRLWKLQHRLTRLMDADPEGQISMLLKNPEVLERYAREVEAFMGDFSTFTARERAYLKRIIPFYSWIRFSLRLAFYTLPIQSPLLVGIGYQLGRLEVDEVKELLGGDELSWALGKLYLDGGEKAIDLYRGNPVLNAVAEIESARDLTSLLPPWVKAIGNQIYQADAWSGKDWKVQGETFSREAIDPGLGSRSRVLFNELASMFTPYRVIHKARAGGRPLGADSLAFDLRPVRYKDQSMTRMRQADFEKRGALLGTLREGFLPLLPRDTSDVLGMAAYEKQRRAKERAKIMGSNASSQGGSGIDYGSALGGSSGSGGFSSAEMWGGSATKGYDSAAMWGAK